MRLGPFPEDKESLRGKHFQIVGSIFFVIDLSLNTEKTLARNDNVNGVCRLPKISISRIIGKAGDYVERL